MYNRLERILACDGRTDRRTYCHDIVRAMHTRRAVKIGRGDYVVDPYICRKVRYDPLWGFGFAHARLGFLSLLVILARTVPWQNDCLSVRLSDTQRYSFSTVIHILSFFSPSSSIVSQKTVHFCFCQNFVRFPRILISFGR